VKREEQGGGNNPQGAGGNNPQGAGGEVNNINHGEQEERLTTLITESREEGITHGEQGGGNNPPRV